MKTYLLLISSVSVALTASSPALADEIPGNPTTPVTALELAMGGTARANPDAFSNILLSPAVLALIPRYELRVDGALQPAEPNLWSSQLTAVDSRTGPVTVGAGYRWTTDRNMEMQSSELPGWYVQGQSRKNKSYTNVIGTGISATDQNRRWAVGISGSYWWRSATIAGAGTGFRLGGSVAARPHEEIIFSLGGGIPIAVENARGVEGEPWLDGGLRVGAGRMIAFFADARLPLEAGESASLAPDLSGGGEWIIAELFALRGGTLRSGSAQAWAASGGIGVVSPQASLDYALFKGIGAEGEAAMGSLHQLSLRVSF